MLRASGIFQLTLLATFLFANAQDNFIHKSYVTGCQTTAVSRFRFLYFIEPTEPQYTLSILTEWPYYAHDLATILPAAGFRLVPEPNQTDSKEYCGWKPWLRVSKHGIVRGYVTYKRRGIAPLHARETGELLHDDAPSNKTKGKIDRVLNKHGPYRDITELVAITVGPIVGLALLYGIGVVLLKLFVPEKQESEDIELTSMKGDRTTDLILTPLPSYPDLSHLTRTRDTGAPRLDEKSIKEVVARSDEVNSIEIGDAYSVSAYSF